VVRKVDWPPLLAPGRHYMSLIELRRYGVDRFEGKAFAHRERIFLSFEGLIQELLVAKIPCQVRVDGSFLTEKPDPDDIDAVVALDFDVSEMLSDDQRIIIDRINLPDGYLSIDIGALVNYPRNHEHFDGWAAADQMCNCYESV
jgi:hypothetical protein